MPYKDPVLRAQKQKEYSRKYYQANKSAQLARSNKTRAEGRKQFRAFKATLSCIKCGENHPAALDFHHHTPKKDNVKISKLLADGRFTKAIQEIAEKCVVLCSNCHRKHHYEERHKVG
jgi:hypothetical protein